VQNGLSLRFNFLSGSLFLDKKKLKPFEIAVRHPVCERHRTASLQTLRCTVHISQTWVDTTQPAGGRHHPQHCNALGKQQSTTPTELLRVRNSRI